MIQLSLQHKLGLLFTLFVIIFLGIHSGKKVKNESDFSTGGKSVNTTFVTGALISTLIGGSSTIGTAQQAYVRGISALWFTIGTGIGCILFGLIFVKPLRNSNCSTIQQVISNEYGTLSGVIASVLSSLSIIINVVAQILSAHALMTTIFGFTITQSIIITIIIMFFYIVFGGVLGTGILGNVKLILIYITIIFGTSAIYKFSGGINNIYYSLPSDPFMNLFSNGYGKSIGSAISVIVGVICGQIYVQTILSGKDDKTAKNGAIIAGLLLPPVGLGATLIGMFMRINYPYIDSSQAFPLFVINHMPHILGGAVLATLLIALVGTGSGMALGFGTMMTKDIYKKFINHNINGKLELIISRISIIIVFVISALLSSSNYDSTIISWSFLATGIRGTVLFIPEVCSLFLKDKIDSKYIVASCIIGIIFHLAGEFCINLSFDPIILGIGSCAFISLIGVIVKYRNNNNVSYPNN